MYGSHAPSFLFFDKPAVQNPNIQPGVLLFKMKDQQSMSFFIYCHLMNFEVLFPGLYKDCIISGVLARPATLTFQLKIPENTPVQ